MVTLPKEFTATRLPGYFWNVAEKKLYSIKISGELRELKKSYPSHFNHLPMPGYYVSYKGNRKFLSIDYLHNLEATDSEIKVQKT